VTSTEKKPVNNKQNIADIFTIELSSTVYALSALFGQHVSTKV